MWFLKQKPAGLFIVLFFIVLRPEIYAQPVTNLQLLTHLADSLLAEASRDLNLERPGPIIIKSLDKDEEISWFVEKLLFELLKRGGARNIFVYRPDSSFKDGGSSTLVEFKVFELGVDYVDRKGGALLGTAKLRRRGYIGLSVRFLNTASGEVLANKEIEAERYDWVREDQLTEIENSNISFTRGKFLTRRDASKLIEPVLITGVTGIIVFLFFSLRSR